VYDGAIMVMIIPIAIYVFNILDFFQPYKVRYSTCYIFCQLGRMTARPDPQNIQFQLGAMVTKPQALKN